MKKELFKQFEVLIRERIGEIYASAYAAKGNRREAEDLTVDAIVWGVSKFSGLAKKERIIDLILEYIGKGHHSGFECADLDIICIRAMEKIKKKSRKKDILVGVFTLVFALSIGIGVLVYVLFGNSNLPSGTNDSQIINIVMDDTEMIQGDMKKLTLVNFHCLNDMLKKSSTFGRMDTLSYLDRLTAAIRTPDGHDYMAYNNTETEDGTPVSFTLYRAETTGWKAIGNGIQDVTIINDHGVEMHAVSPIRLAADKDSNVYAVVYFDNAVHIYRYDAEAEHMVLSSAEVVFDENAQVTDFEICYDENYGEKGSVFVMFQADDTFVFAYYDISSDTFTEYEKKLILTQTHSAIFCTEKGVLHMVVQNGLTSVQTLDYYRLTKNGEYYEQRIFSSNGNWISNNSEWVANRGFGNGGITVDEQGKVHIFAVACPSIEESAISHYIIDENGNTERSILPRLYYEDTDIMPTIGALMKDSDGSLYIFELYVDVNARNLMTIGKFEDNTYQAVSVFDIMEFPSNLYKYQIRILNGALVFISNDYDIYYCGIREVKNEISSFG